MTHNGFPVVKDTPTGQVGLIDTYVCVCVCVCVCVSRIIFHLQSMQPFDQDVCAAQFWSLPKMKDTPTGPV